VLLTASKVCECVEESWLDASEGQSPPNQRAVMAELRSHRHSIRHSVAHSRCKAACATWRIRPKDSGELEIITAARHVGADATTTNGMF
jgi:hypothetical protein